MKIKSGFFGTRPVAESKEVKDVADSKSDASSRFSSSSESGVQLSEDSALIQTLREAAKGQEPSRTELIQQAKEDIANGLLGSEEDFQQAITALLQEL